jgi:ectoine hydroxylase-related dioxygenase (phytanoyl-CoA dioxygenase family)
MLRSVFSDTGLDAQFAADGYVTVSLLSAEEVSDLRAFHRSLSMEHQALFTTFISDDIEHKRAVDSRLREVMASHFERLFHHHRPFWGNFFVKPPGALAMELHADYQYVDEQEAVSLNMWVPLQDVDSSNGALGVVPRSHLVRPQVRGTNITKAYRLHADAIRQAHGRVLSLPAGHAVIYDHRLLHWSTANEGSESRLAVTMVGVAEGDAVWHYFAENEDSTTFERYHLRSAEDLICSGFQQRPASLAPEAVMHDCRLVPLTVEDFR